MTTDAWLTGRRGQALAICIGALALLLVWFGVAQPARSWYSDRADLLEQRQVFLIHMRDLAASLPALRAASAGRTGEGKLTGTVMLPGDSDSVAAADLQERVQQMALEAGANLTAVETLPASATAAWHKVALRISLNASWPVLMALVRSIEQSPERILIDDVHFRSPMVIVQPSVLLIQASMVVYGFRPAQTGPRT